MIKIVDGLLAVPTVNDYVSVLRKIEITELQTELLKIQYSAPHHQIKVEDLAIAVSKPIETIVNFDLKTFLQNRSHYKNDP